MILKIAFHNEMVDNKNKIKIFRVKSHVCVHSKRTSTNEYEYSGRDTRPHGIPRSNGVWPTCITIFILIPGRSYDAYTRPER
jgi:hypothetical protein